MIAQQFALPRGVLGTGLVLLASLLPVGRVYGAEPSPVMRAQAASRTRRFADRVELIDARVFDVLTPGGGAVGRAYDGRLVPDLERAGFVELAAAWEPGGNGRELLVTGRRPAG